MDSDLLPNRAGQREQERRELRAQRDEAVTKLFEIKGALRDVTEDRDEWKQQHENLLAMYRESQSKLKTLGML